MYIQMEWNEQLFTRTLIGMGENGPHALMKRWEKHDLPCCFSSQPAVLLFVDAHKRI